MRYLFEDELRTLLARSGLKMVEMNAWLTQVPASAQDWYACVVCKPV